MKEYYKVIINETSEREEEDNEGNIDIKSTLFNVYKEKCGTLEEAHDFIKGHYKYTKLIDNEDETSNYIYRDGEAVKVGYIYKYINSDISHNSEEWTQCDWVSIVKVTEEEVIIK